MKTIKFRGLRKNTEHQTGFKYGNLLNECSIGEVGIGLTEYQYAEVIPETVGQFTGLTDKNLVEIYEGDIVRVDHRDKRYEPANGLIEWNEHDSSWDVGGGCASEVNWSHLVIGNIHENPELIK